jgi:hypothetical protein
MPVQHKVRHHSESDPRPEGQVAVAEKMILKMQLTEHLHHVELFPNSQRERDRAVIMAYAEQNNFNLVRLYAAAVKGTWLLDPGDLLCEAAETLAITGQTLVAEMLLQHAAYIYQTLAARECKKITAISAADKQEIYRGYADERIGLARERMAAAAQLFR